MAGASDKARFYLERHIPSLQSDLRKQLFTQAETTAITSKRSSFGHLLNARGATPADWARYATYEMNLASLRKKRCKRLGVKNGGGGGKEGGGVEQHAGQRTVFFVLERATKKFPGDMGLWMQYIRFCQREKASRKLARVFTGVLRLKPREWGVWVLAAKWYAEEQGDMSTARSYMQRGLRFCKDQRELWVEYCKMEMVYLAKLAARRKILGLDEEKEEKDVQMDDTDDNMIALPTITAADIAPDATKGIEEVNASTLTRLANAPAFTGAIPTAIFDAAMKQFAPTNNASEVAEAFFDLIFAFPAVPSTPKLLHHILAHLQISAPNSISTVVCGARLPLLGLDALSPDFPPALGKTLAALKTGMASLPAKAQPALAEKAVLLLLPYLAKPGEGTDEDVDTVLVASVNRYLRIAAASPKAKKAKLLQALAGRANENGKVTGAQMVEVYSDFTSTTTGV